MKKSEKQKKKRRFRRPRLSQVVYMLFFLATVIYVSNRGGAFSYALFYAALGYPVLAFLYLLYNRMTFRIYQELPVRELKKNMEEPYQLTVENAGIFPTAVFTMYSYQGCATFGEDMTGQAMSLLPKEKREFDTTLSCRYAGSYVAGIRKITFRDCFGLLSLSLRIPIPLQLQVLPMVNREKSEKARELLTLTMGASGGRMKEKENNLGVDMAQYRPGDPVKRIHWKNYARSGELFVRLPEEKDLQLISVALLAEKIRESKSNPGESATEDLARRDRFLDTAVSVAAYFAEQKRPVQFFYYNAGVEKVLVENYEGLHRLSLEISKELVLRGEASEVESRVLEAAEHWQCPLLVLREADEEEKTPEKTEAESAETEKTKDTKETKEEETSGQVLEQVG